MERFRRYRLRGGDAATSAAALARLAAIAHDRMTECVVASPPLASFGEPAEPEPVRTVPLLAGGRAALEAANQSLGLGMDPWCAAPPRRCGRRRCPAAPLPLRPAAAGTSTSTHASSQRSCGATRRTWSSSTVRPGRAGGGPGARPSRCPLTPRRAPRAVSQSNSEHSRHWFFKGRLVVEGAEFPATLFGLVQVRRRGGGGGMAERRRPRAPRRRRA